MADVTKCKKCEAPATMVAPEDLCNVCWANWWVDGILEGGEYTSEFRASLLKETLDNLQDQSEDRSV